MTNKFENIDETNEKVRLIINAAYEEFAKYGESKASLNKILKSAGLSKGVFYHYFTDKDELFNYLMYYTIELSMKDFDRRIDWNSSDIIKRICDVSKLKFEVMKQHPYLIEFGDAYKSNMAEQLDVVYTNDWREKFYNENIDFSRLKNPEDAHTVLHIVRWSYKGLFMNILSGGNHPSEEMFEAMYRKCDELYEVLTRNFYKQISSRLKGGSYDISF